jgi:hypothetical protein
MVDVSDTGTLAHYVIKQSISHCFKCIKLSSHLSDFSSNHTITQCDFLLTTYFYILTGFKFHHNLPIEPGTTRVKSTEKWMQKTQQIFILGMNTGSSASCSINFTTGKTYQYPSDGRPDIFLSSQITRCSFPSINNYVLLFSQQLAT